MVDRLALLNQYDWDILKNTVWEKASGSIKRAADFIYGLVACKQY